MDALNQHKQKLETELNKIEYLNQLEKKTNVPKLYLVGALAAIIGTLIFVNVAAGLVANLVGFLYPAYASFKAIESPDKEDDTLWLTYWVVYSFFNVLEYFIDWILFWLPFYFLFKVGFLIYLFHPQTKGAIFIYQRFIRQFLIEQEKYIDSKTREISEEVSKKYDEAKNFANKLN